MTSSSADAVLTVLSSFASVPEGSGLSGVSVFAAAAGSGFSGVSGFSAAAASGFSGAYGLSDFTTSVLSVFSPEAAVFTGSPLISASTPESFSLLTSTLAFIS